MQPAPCRAGLSISKSGDKPDQQATSSASQAPDPFALVASIKSRGPAPVHLWDPPFCGDIDMLIQRDGTWLHEGRPIRRPAMVRLFASVLKREGDDYFLVTPVEKVGIQVEDCPFLVTEMEVQGSGTDQCLRFTTNTGEVLSADDEHGLLITTDPETGEPHPTLHVRSGLRGLLVRSVFYRLIELAVDEGERGTGVYSRGVFFPITG